MTILRPTTLTSRLLLRAPTRNFTSTNPLLQPSSSTTSSNRILDAVRTPPTFHDYLRLTSANNTLLLALFTTSACAPCRTITPLLTSLVRSRSPKPQDRFSSLAFTEIELDSGDTSNGSMMDLAVLWGANSLPTLIGFGGRRADRVTERLVETRMLSDRARMEDWVDREMEKGDQFPTATGGGGGEGKGILGRLFG